MRYNARQKLQISIFHCLLVDGRYSDRPTNPQSWARVCRPGLCAVGEKFPIFSSGQRSTNPGYVRRKFSCFARVPAQLPATF